MIAYYEPVANYDFDFIEYYGNIKTFGRELKRRIMFEARCAQFYELTDDFTLGIRYDFDLDRIKQVFVYSDRDESETMRRALSIFIQMAVINMYSDFCIAVRMV